MFYIKPAEVYVLGQPGGILYMFQSYMGPCRPSHVSVYKCLSLIVGFAITVTIWPREVASCRDIILHTVATFWPCRFTEFTLAGPPL